MRWHPGSWRAFEARQQPAYPDPLALDAALAALASRAPLVSIEAVDALTARLAEAQSGRALLLQAGDCAELLSDTVADVRDMKVLIEELAAELAEEAGLPVVSVGRIAGQFAKPRSIVTERRGETVLPVWRGDSVNAMAFGERARTPDPARLLAAQAHAAATATLLDCSQVAISHELLLLAAEQAQLRRDPESGRWFAGSGHFLWIGARTLFPGSAHLELARGLANPLGLKCGPELDPDALPAMLETRNPGRQAGRITLIVRLGCERVADGLPLLARAVREAGQPVLWCCDPLHGNTGRGEDGIKRRAMAAIEAETAAFFALAAEAGLRPAGLHLEMTHRSATECEEQGMAAQADRGDCRDPRLNPAQARRIVTLAAQALARRRAPVPA
jgi:3-deoxy-7-phosphoheptulonate synthase